MSATQRPQTATACENYCILAFIHDFTEETSFNSGVLVIFTIP